MSDTDSDDETEGAIDLSLPKPGMLVLTDPSPDNSGVIGNKLPQHQFVKPDKPSVKSVSQAVKKQHQVASMSKLPSPKASTPVVAATKLPTPLASTSKAPTSRDATSKSSTSEALASKASTSKSPSPKASTPERPALKLPTPLGSTSKASTSKASTSKASTSKASTSKASTSKTPSPKASTPELPASKLPTPLASTSKASTPKASTSKASTSKASTSKLSSSKASTPEVPAPKLPTPLASTSRPSPSKASTSKASTSKASTSKASTSKASTSKASTSKASTSKASTSKASTSKASPSKPSTSRELKELQFYTLGFKGRKPIVLKETSKSRVSTSTSADSGDDEASFWLRTAKTKFGSSEFREYLREANFTERQAESLQSLLQDMTQKMNNAINNSDRLVKTHKCNNCEFTICHQCVCLFFLHAPIPINDLPAVIEAEKTVICICNFAFFHIHDIDSSRAEGVNTASVERMQQPPTRKSNIAIIRCSACDMIVLIEHAPERKVENTLIQWSAVESDNEQEFHACITAHLRRRSVPPLTLGEMFMCTNKCCLLFHRCDE